MNRIQASTIIYLGAIASTLVVLFVLMFDRFTYYDYEVTQCAAGDATLHVRLTGSYDPSRPRTRASPYNLFIEVSGVDDKHAITSVSVRPASPGLSQMFPSMERFEGGGSGASDVSFRLLSTGLPLGYDDQLIEGTILGELPGEQPKRFSCLVGRDLHSEWRAPWMDAFMSV